MKHTKKINIDHVVSKLYKIKEIDRRKKYKTQELQRIVVSHPIGLEVIADLNKLKIGPNYLFENDYYLLSIILGDFLKN